MIIKELRRMKIQVDPRGKIKTGKKVFSETAKREIPKALDYFNVEKFPEIIALYGEKPRELLIAAPSDNIADVFDDRFVLYGSNQQAIRRCDGETCIHRIAEKLGGREYGAGEETECICAKYSLHNGNERPHELAEHQWEEMRKKACDYTANLKAFVLNPYDGKLISTLPVLFETGSRNSGSAIYTALSNLAGLTTLIVGQPKLAFIPMRIWVNMVSGKSDAKMKFPIIELTPPANISEIIERLRSVGRALGWDSELMKRIENPRPAIMEGSSVVDGLIHRIQQAVDRSELVAIGHTVLGLRGKISEEKVTELQELVKSRWNALGFGRKILEPEEIDPTNPLGLP